MLKSLFFLLLYVIWGSLTALANPRNDAFSSAIVLSGRQGTITLNNRSATREPGEPVHGWRHASKTLWYRWKAPRDMTIRFQLMASDISEPDDTEKLDAVLAVYSGTDISNLRRLVLSDGSDDGSSDRNGAHTEWSAQAGQIYSIVACGYGHSGGPGKLSWSGDRRVQNETRATATDISAVPAGQPIAVLIEGSMSDQDSDVSLPFLESGTVWYRWRAPDRGYYRFKLGFDAVNSQAQLALMGEIPSGLAMLAAASSNFSDPTINAVTWAEANQTIWIAVNGSFNSDCQLIWTAVDAICPGDRFAAPIVLEGVDGHSVGELRHASREVGEPRHSFRALEPNPLEGTVWYRWRAPVTGRVNLRANFVPRNRFHIDGFAVCVYQGSELNSLRPAGYGSQTITSETTTVSVNVLVKAGVEYRIVLGLVRSGWDFETSLWGNPCPASLTWKYETQLSPPNDDVWMAVSLKGLQGNIRGTTVGALGGIHELFDQDVPGPSNLGPDSTLTDLKLDRARVWYMYQATSAKAFTCRATRAGGGINLLLAEVTVEFPRLLQRSFIATDSNFPACVHLPSPVPGKRYLVGVETWSKDKTQPLARGAFSLQWSSGDTQGPDNDDFTNATLLPGLSGELAGTLDRATREPSEPLYSHSFEAGREWQSVWYRWKATSNGWLEIENLENWWASHAVYNGTRLDRLVELKRDFSSSRYTFARGQTINIVVHNTQDTGGTFSLKWKISSSPPNDNIARAVVLSGSQGRFSASGMGASAEVGEPQHAGVHPNLTVWYRWTCPQDTTFIFQAESNGTRAVGVYEGPAIWKGDWQTLTPISGLVSRSSWANIFQPEGAICEFRVRQGRTYYIVVDASEYPDDPDKFSWHAGFTTVPPLNIPHLVGAAGAKRDELFRATPYKIEGAFEDEVPRLLWHRWTAPRSGRAWMGILELPEEGTGRALICTRRSNGKIVPVPDDDPSLAHALVIVERGREYLFGVGTVGLPGPLQFGWDMGARNDNFENPETISRLTGEITGSLAASTYQRAQGEPQLGKSFQGARGGSVWYRWQPQEDGVVTLYCLGGNLAMYAGDKLSTLHRIPTLVEPAELLSVQQIQVRRGNVYRLAVYGPARGTGTFKLAWFVRPESPTAPDVISLHGAEGVATTDLIAALLAMAAEGKDALIRNYQWTAPRSGYVKWFSSFSGEEYLTLQAFKRDADGEKQLIVEKTVVKSEPTPKGAGFRFHVQKGDEISLRLNSDALLPTLYWSMGLDNDSFSQPQLLDPKEGRYKTYVPASTWEAGEMEVEGSGSLWFSFTAGANGKVQFLSHSSEWSLRVFQGTALTNLHQVSPTSSGTSDVLLLPVQAGEKYYIQAVGSGFDTDDNNTILDISWAYVGEGDVRGRPKHLGSNVSGQVNYSTLGALPENENDWSTDPDPDPNNSTGTVWFRWVAPSTGIWTWDTRGSDFNTRLVLYHARSSGLEFIQANNNYNPVDFTSQCVLKAQAGEAYLIKVQGSANFLDVISADLPDFGKITLRWHPAPSNDNFADAVVLTATQGQILDNNRGATREHGYIGTTGPSILSSEFSLDGETFHAGNPVVTSLWYKWTAPTNGRWTFDTLGTQFDTTLAVYRGENVLDTTQIAANDDIGNSLTESSVSFQTQAGVTYYIAVDGYRGEEGRFQLQWAVEPSNDNIKTAFPLSGTSGHLAFTNRGASRTLGETAAEGELGHYPNIVTARSIWYRFVPSSDGRFTANLDSSFKWVTAAYVGSDVEQLTQLSSRAQEKNGGQLVFNTTRGRPILITVDGNRGAAGNGFLNWDFQPLTRPANDDLSQAELLLDETGETAGDSTGATREQGEKTHIAGTSPAVPQALGVSPIPFDVNTITDLVTRKFPVEPNFYQGNNGGRSVWYKWTAPRSWPQDKTFAIWLKSAAFNAELTAYRLEAGSPPAQSKLVRLKSAVGQTAAILHFRPQPGQTYYFVVDGQQGSGGRFTLGWGQKESKQPRPANDDRASAFRLSAPSDVVRGNNEGATHEAGEPQHAERPGSASVWFTWKAPGDGTAVFSTQESTFDTLLAVYTWDETTQQLTSVTHSDDVSPYVTSLVSFQTQFRQLYYIAVDGFGGNQGDYRLGWRYSSSVANSQRNTTTPKSRKEF